MLGRGGSGSWIGEKIQSTLAAYPIVTSAVIDTKNTVVRFTLANTITSGYVVNASGGRTVVFDLSIGDWQSVDTIYGSTANQPAQDACVVTVGNVARYAWLAADGTVYLEREATDVAAYLDGSTWITMAAETAWFKTAGIQGRQHFELALSMMRKRSAMNISISIGYDYRTTYAATSTWSSATLDTLLSSGWPITQLRHDGSDDAEGQAIRVRLADSDPSLGGTGQGATWLALTLDITPKEGPAEVSAEAS
jgi:hypothetical protein